MNRISRTGLATLGAVAAVAVGGLGMAYATTPSGQQAQASAAPQDTQVEALNRTALSLQSEADKVQRTLAAATSASPSESPEPSDSPSESAEPTTRSETAEPSDRPTAVEPAAHETDAPTQALAHSEADAHEQAGSHPEAEHLETDGPETGGAHD